MKKLLLLFIIPFLSFGQDVYNDLLYYYSFSENGNFLAADATGNNFTATLNDVENTTDRFGNQNSAKYFNGESSFISIPYQSIALAEFPISYSFWVKLDSVGHVGEAISNEWVENYYSGAWVTLLPDKITMGYGDCGPAGQQSRRSKYTNHFFLTEQWHHVVCVFTDQVNLDTEINEFGSYAMDMKIYINGTLTTGDYSGSGNSYNTPCYLSGYTQYGGSMGVSDSNAAWGIDTLYYFKGKLDEVGYWTRELSDSEVLDIYQNGLFDECQGVIDECGVCSGDGPQITCWDDSLVCNPWDCPEETGCMYEIACNFNSEATIENGSCLFPGDICELDSGELGFYNSSCECIENSSFVQESDNSKTIIKTIDVLGRKIINQKRSFQLHIYDDGTVEKKYLIK